MNKKLPNFICVGAQKAGTTTLHDILKNHSQIYLPKLKEAHFFDIEERYEKGLEWWVENYFNTYNEEKVMGVMTPEYLYYKEIPEKIFNDLGANTKIVIILRNPVSRAYSHYQMSIRRGFETLDFKIACEEEKNRIDKDSFSRNHFSYISRGLYYKQVKRYLDLFGEKNVLILSFENDIIKNINSTIIKLEKFLEIEHEGLNTNIQSNSASIPRFKFINKLLYQDSILKKILKKFIKTNYLKIKIGLFIDNLNQKNIKSKKLSEEEKDIVLKKYFYEDIIKLEKLINQKTGYIKKDHI